MSRQRRESGFTLIEVIVALAILAVALAVLFHVISDGLDRARESRNELTAGALAQSLLARAGTDLPLRPGERDGAYSNGFRWHLEIAPYGTPSDRDAWAAMAFAVRATISWQDGSLTRSRSLTTIKLAPKPKPPA